MTALWRDDGDGWQLAEPAGFPDEDTLHTLVEEEPRVLPLSGTPRVVLLGREVALGSGYADLVGVESSGRPVVVEVKLARNAEARRAVVAQALAYAAYLHGLTPAELEQDVLAGHLQQRGYSSLVAAVSADDQAGEFDADAFTAALAEHLSVGSARIVFVLDSAPPEAGAACRLPGDGRAKPDHRSDDAWCSTSSAAHGCSCPSVLIRSVPHQTTRAQSRPGRPRARSLRAPTSLRVPSMPRPRPTNHCFASSLRGHESSSAKASLACTRSVGSPDDTSCSRACQTTRLVS